jgi:hypothetical protein
MSKSIKTPRDERRWFCCKCPKGWCYHRLDCIRGPSMQLAEAIVDKFAGAAPSRVEVDRRQAISPAPPAGVKDDDGEA